MSKIYIEVEDGLVNAVYTDSEEELDVILCDHDNADQETEWDCFNFECTNNINELEDNMSNLNCIF